MSELAQFIQAGWPALVPALLIAGPCAAFLLRDAIKRDGYTEHSRFGNVDPAADL